MYARSPTLQSLAHNIFTTSTRNMATQGFGCMGLSAFYGSAQRTTPEKAKAVIEHAVSKGRIAWPYFNSCVSPKVIPLGVTLFNTATFYGPLNEEGFGANLRLLKTAIADIDRSKIQLMVKICMDTRWVRDLHRSRTSALNMLIAGALWKRLERRGCFVPHLKKSCVTSITR
jgi:aryl-alcohol dehydrogenase-like predicted oxidoreductase